MPGSRRRKAKLRERSPIKVKIIKTSARKSRYVKREPKSESESDDVNADSPGTSNGSNACQGSKKRKGYRQNYSLKDLLDAYNMVKYENMPVQTAAKTFGVPSTTLRDRVRGNVTLESVRPGPSSLLSIDQEMTLVDHISYMASIGCGYTRSEIFDLATDLAVHLGLIKEGRQLQRSWYRRFRSRWPVISAVRPDRVSRKRKPTTVALEQESIKKYFEELKEVLEEHDLMEKPHRIFTLDEGFVPENLNIDNPEACIKAVGCGNAIGSVLPPYLVFPQSSDTDTEGSDEKIVSNAHPGALIRFRETYDVWSESEIFQDYIKSLFLKSPEVGGTSPEDPILIMYDRAKHHISSCIEWARKQNIILSLLPPFFGYAACSEQIGCLGQLKRTTMQLCQKYLFFNSDTKLHKSDLSKFISEAYNKVLSSENIIALFRKTGTYPYNPDGIAKDRLPAYIIMPNKLQSVGKTGEMMSSAMIMTKAKKRSVAANKKKRASRTQPYKKDKRKRKSYKQSSSESLSESDLDDLLESDTEVQQELDSDGESAPFQPPSIRAAPKIKRTPIASEDSLHEPKTEIVEEVPLTGTIIAQESQDDEESEGEYTCISDGQLFTLKCVICKKYNPPKTFMTEDASVISWTQCDSCQAWSHLCCSSLSVPDSECPFLCPACTAEFKLFGNHLTAANITEWINAKRAITENIMSAQNS